jgi:hypothetical protein
VGRPSGKIEVNALSSNFSAPDERKVNSSCGSNASAGRPGTAQWDVADWPFTLAPAKRLIRGRGAINTVPRSRPKLRDRLRRLWFILFFVLCKDGSSQQTEDKHEGTDLMLCPNIVSSVAIPDIVVKVRT